jgi:OFA family oxalate/formate antiporter-like MFS transporter
MFVAFLLASVAIGSLALYGHNPFWFIVSSGLIYFTWGEIYSLFPATCTDSYGAQYATTNAGMLYTAKGTAALLVPLANLVSPAGDWHLVLWMGASANIIAAVMAILVLRPMRKAHRAAG